MPYTGLKFWSKALDRAIRTFAQTLVAVIGGGTIGVLDVDWQAALSIAAMAAILSILTSIATPDAVLGEPVVQVVTSPDLMPGLDGKGLYAYSPDGTPSTVVAARALNEDDED